VFGRMWELYLAYSEAGFRSGYLDVLQVGFTKAGVDKEVALTEPIRLET
jgi:cyclopropane-fatty-acyl-phospholipid synthase